MKSHSSLASELRKSVRGEVSFDDGARALYATDASNYRQVPIGVVVPEDMESVHRALEICRRYEAPVLTRGAGTSLAGQCCNVAVVLDFSRHLNQILEINPQQKNARVQPGVILDSLRHAAGAYGLTFGPDPATHNRCTLGGMIGNNACGVHSVMAGKTAANTEALEILTYDGVRMRVGKTSEEELERILRQDDARAKIYGKLKSLRDRYGDLIRTRTPKLPRRVSGYNLEELLPENGFHVARALVGTEGTCVTVLEATLRLIEEPPARSLVVLGFPDIYSAGDAVAEILSFKPIGLEGLDEFYVRNMKKHGLHLREVAELPVGAGWLLVEFGGCDPKEAEARARAMLDGLPSSIHRPAGKWYSDPGDQRRIWGLRESSFGATVFVPGERDTYSGFEDSAVAPERLGDYMRALRKLYEKYGYYAVTYGHFGDGCIHTRISFDLKTGAGIRTYRRFQEEAADLVVRFGGSFSGEHGDGQTWGDLLPKMYGEEMVQAFREFKAIWDPRHKMNPGKVVNAYRSDENLRLKNYPVADRGRLHFGFTEDGGNFARTTERCIGIGKCLKTDEGIMCPSYMVTREEKHSPRGRAHLLHEMIRGEVIQDGWQSEAVKEALDLCLACKGCKTECPVSVDVATYKAEFLSHYYERRQRPLSATLFGMISTWAEIAGKIPWLANFVTQTPGLRDMGKAMAGMAHDRSLPRFAGQTFRDWFEKSENASSRKSRGTRNDGLGKVLLWPDTFTNYFQPEIAKAAVEVLEFAGFEVKLPPPSLCCGRPLYDFGMLDQAKDYLEHILQVLQPDLEKGICVVGLEPSCLAVFQDELPGLFPGDSRAQCLSLQSFVFAEFLDRYAESVVWPSLNQKALVQIHCHQRALMGHGSDCRLMDKLGLDYRILDAGCCGMAGNFGFEKGHYEISVKAAERVLLPEIEKAGREVLILADGFSCREQIRHLSKRKPLHLAEVMAGGIKSRA